MTLLALLATGSSLFMLAQGGKVAHAASTGFSFTAAGDYSQTNATTANLNYIAHSGASFNLALGDFSYNTTVNASTWSSYARSILPANFPFEILSGGHDVSQISTYAADLPNQMSGMSGTYAGQYYFDYPSTGPLARFILISPSVLSTYSYSYGTPGYDWVSSTIDAARSAGIHWIVVAMHENCFVIGSKTCPGQDLLDLLLSKKVDLILEAQKHDYQASKQLALSSSCPTLSITSYNASCAVNSTNSMSRGAGSVIVVQGTGGATPLLSVNTSDPKIGYFRTWMGGNINPTWGVSQFSVSSTQISMQFVPVTGTFSDSFTING